MRKITYNNPMKKSECFRLGRHSKCFCGHELPIHNQQYFGKKANTGCQKCPCKKFAFVPSRPEECGMYWLVRRKDFNVATWRPPCKYFYTDLGANTPARNISQITLCGAKNVRAAIFTRILRV